MDYEFITNIFTLFPIIFFIVGVSLFIFKKKINTIIYVLWIMIFIFLNLPIYLIYILNDFNIATKLNIKNIISPFVIFFLNPFLIMLLSIKLFNSKKSFTYILTILYIIIVLLISI